MTALTHNAVVGNVVVVGLLMAAMFVTSAVAIIPDARAQLHPVAVS